MGRNIGSRVEDFGWMVHTEGESDNDDTPHVYQTVDKIIRKGDIIAANSMQSACKNEEYVSQDGKSVVVGEAPADNTRFRFESRDGHWWIVDREKGFSKDQVEAAMALTILRWNNEGKPGDTRYKNLKVEFHDLIPWIGSGFLSLNAPSFATPI